MALSQTGKTSFGLSKAWKLILLGVFLVVLDQVTKILVKTNMTLGESIPLIGDFLRICFVENMGMAFGLKWGGIAGKIALSLFRIILFGFLWWWIAKLLRQNEAVQERPADQGDSAGQQTAKVPFGVCVGLTVIAAGALGNILDSWFYGLIFSASDFTTVAQFGGSYAPFLMGKVVDMISFSIFPPVFNVADSCVTCGAAYLILFQWRFFSGK